MKKDFLRKTAIALAFVSISLPAMALDLSEARSKNLVGEKNDGYVEAIQPSTDVNLLVSDVNARRKDEYTRISKENGQAVDVVAKLASGQIIQKLSPGTSYQDASGKWKKK